MPFMKCIFTLQTADFYRVHNFPVSLIVSVRYKYKTLNKVTRIRKIFILMGTWLFDYAVLGYYNTIRLLNCQFHRAFAPLASILIEIKSR